MTYDRRVRLILSLIVAGCAKPAVAPKPAELPAEVEKLVERWEMCGHFSGEEPYHAERAKQIADGQAEWCPGNEAARDRLRVKWKGNAAVQDALRKPDDIW
jgi:hypothetical protein